MKCYFLLLVLIASTAHIGTINALSTRDGRWAGSIIKFGYFANIFYSCTSSLELHAADA
jgi:hypothetical protein